jgi:hypothetical protein
VFLDGGWGVAFYTQFVKITVVSADYLKQNFFVIARSEATKQSINKVGLGFQPICCKKHNFCGLLCQK